MAARPVGGAGRHWLTGEAQLGSCIALRPDRGLHRNLDRGSDARGRRGTRGRLDLANSPARSASSGWAKSVMDFTCIHEIAFFLRPRILYWVGWLPFQDVIDSIVSLVLTVGMAAVSYNRLERPFLRLKMRGLVSVLDRS